MKKTKDQGQPPQYPQQGVDPRSRQDQPWQPQYDPFAHQQRIGQQNQQYAPQPPPWQQQPAMPPQMPRSRKRKSWPARHKALTGLTAFVALVVVIVIATESGKPSTKTADTSAAGSSASSSAAVSSAASLAPSAPASPAGPSLTGGQQQTVDSAQEYLSEGQGFSQQGLLNQLTSSFGEGFSKSDAEFAIKYVNPNWDQQAVDSATNYLSEGQGFSQQGLLQQLTSSSGEGFTETQAEYAVSHLHPDWDAQAVDAAKGYLGDGEGFSRSSLIQQLTSSYGDGFTEAQAEYGVNKAMS